MEEGSGIHSSSSDGTGPHHRVLLISAGAGHSVALLSFLGTSQTAMWTLSLTNMNVESNLFLSDYEISGGWRHTMALTTEGKLYGWGWNKFGQVGVGDNSDHCSPKPVKFPHDQKVVHVSCGWRHTLAVTDRHNIFSWGRGTNGQLGHGDSLERNVPKIIEAISMDGSSGQQIEASKIDISSGKTTVSPTERYAVVPNENVLGRTVFLLGRDGNDSYVPENDVKRMRI
ncbi:unnamed protein product [Fraxinus pennsylvanica]|uniref:Ultraviolet-B receptor UVR8 n=1 Tax=Fraxinus pennsylvanica TaxID=56036 RepID=A0AAD2EAG6_9LAMI|nr:unnamed protein product [Fraxinus pennsylvanica]